MAGRMVGGGENDRKIGGQKGSEEGGSVGWWGKEKKQKRLTVIVPLGGAI